MGSDEVSVLRAANSALRVDQAEVTETARLCVKDLKRKTRELEDFKENEMVALKKLFKENIKLKDSLAGIPDEKMKLLVKMQDGMTETFNKQNALLNRFRAELLEEVTQN